MKLQEVLKETRSAFLYAGFFSMFINVLMLVPSLYMLQVYDRVMSSRSLETLTFLTLIVALLFLVLGLLQYIRSKILVRAGNKIDIALNGELFDAIFDMAKVNPGRVNAGAISDLTKLRQYLTGNGIFALFDAPWFPFYLFVMYLFSPFLAYFTIFAAVVLLVITFVNERATKSALERANMLHASSNSYINKNIQNAEIVHAMGMHENIKNIWLKRHLGFLAVQSHASDEAGKWSNLSKTLRQFFQALTYGLGAYLAIKGEISAGTIIAGAVLLGRALAPLDLLTASWKGFADAKRAYKNLSALLQEREAMDAKMQLPAPKGALSIESVSVVPPLSKQLALRNINAKIEQGDIVGIIGPSGSGKSSLARAVLGVWPLHGGKVRLDGADIHQWDTLELGSYIGYLPQDIELFEGSVSENIARLGAVDAQKVVEAAKKAGVHEMILHFASGYDTKIGPGGIGLSGGQKQRIGFARAIYDNPVLVVLDEPNSNLDQEGERALIEGIRSLKEHKSTVLIISHKMDVLGVTNKLMVLKDGLMRMYGPTAEVLQKLSAPVETKQAPRQQMSVPKINLSKPSS